MEDTTRPSRMKKIFAQMENSEVNIQTFYEQLEKEFGNYCPFSKFKSLLSKLPLLLSFESFSIILLSSFFTFESK